MAIKHTKAAGLLYVSTRRCSCWPVCEDTGHRCEATKEGCTYYCSVLGSQALLDKGKAGFGNYSDSHLGKSNSYEDYIRVAVAINR